MNFEFKKWSTEDIIAAMTFTGGTNASAFETYITQVLVPNMKPGATVVMDNFSSHQVTGIREAIEFCGSKIGLFVSLLSRFFTN